MRRHYKKYFFIGVIIAIVSALMLPSQKVEETGRDYADIQKEGILRVTIKYGANSYHVNEEGELKGLHFQLIQQFAQEHGLKLEVIPEMDVQKQDAMLLSGACDLIADGRLLTTDYDSTSVHFTQPMTVDRLILVQRKAEVDSLCPHLNSQIDLAGKSICLPMNSPFKQRIHHLMEEIGDSIYIQEVPRYGSEQLMAMVAHGDICYAICEENVVRTHLSQFPQIDDQLAISFNQFYSWVTRTNSPALLDSLNTWLVQQGFRWRQ